MVPYPGAGDKHALAVAEPQPPAEGIPDKSKAKKLAFVPDKSNPSKLEFVSGNLTQPLSLKTSTSQPSMPPPSPVKSMGLVATVWGASLHLRVVPACEGQFHKSMHTLFNKISCFDRRSSS